MYHCISILTHYEKGFIMLNTLYTIAGGIALTIGALGASDDFDGAQLAQNAFFGPEDEIEAADEQETATEEVLAAKDVFEWDEIASNALGMSLTGSDELTEDEKLEVVVLTGETPDDISVNLEELPQIEENSQSEGLSEEEFYCILEKQFNDAMTSLDSEEALTDSEPLVIEAVQEDLEAVELQPEDDENAEKALEEAQSNAESNSEEAENKASEAEPWVVINGLPDIPEMDMDNMTDQPEKKEQSDEPEQPAVEDVNVQEIPVMDSFLVDLPEIDTPDDDNIPLFNETDVEETKIEETETENLDVDEAEDADVEKTDVDETEDALIVEPLEDDASALESKDEALLIPSIEIPPAVITEEQRAKISEEVDAIANQSDNFDGWIPRQIPVSGSAEDVQLQTKPEDDFIQDFSRQNVKESILENNGIDLK